MYGHPRIITTALRLTAFNYDCRTPVLQSHKNHYDFGRFYYKKAVHAAFAINPSYDERREHIMAQIPQENLRALLLLLQVQRQQAENVLSLAHVAQVAQARRRRRNPRRQWI